MNQIRTILTTLAVALFMPCAAQTVQMPSDAITLKSPGDVLQMQFAVVDGVPTYALRRQSADVLLPSRLGFQLFDRRSLDAGFVLKASSTSTFDETWKPVWGEEAEIRNHYNELFVTLEQPQPANDGQNARQPAVMQVRFRLYDDGLGFRYEFPMKNDLTYFNIKEELTEFALTGDHLAWWIPGDYSTQEFNPTESHLSEVRNLSAAPRRRGGWRCPSVPGRWRGWHGPSCPGRGCGEHRS